MLRKILLYLIPAFLIVAVFLKSFGIDHIEFSDSYYRFFTKVLITQNEWKIAIPNIPPIPTGDIVNNDFFQFIADIGNFFINIINIVSLIINTLISVIMFLVSTLVNLYEAIRDILAGGVLVFS